MTHLRNCSGFETNNALIRDPIAWEKLPGKFSEVGSKMVIVGRRGSQDIDALGKPKLGIIFVFSFQEVLPQTSVIS